MLSQRFIMPCQKRLCICVEYLKFNNPKDLKFYDKCFNLHLQNNTIEEICKPYKKYINYKNLKK